MFLMLVMLMMKMTAGVLVVTEMQQMQLMVDIPNQNSSRTVIVLAEAGDMSGFLTRRTCLVVVFSVMMDNMSPWHVQFLQRYWPKLSYSWTGLAAFQIYWCSFHSLLPNLKPEAATWPYSLPPLYTCSLYWLNLSLPPGILVVYPPLVHDDDALDVPRSQG